MPGIFAEEHLTEIALDNAPLVKVLVQVRFPAITKIETPEGIQGFQERLRARYPVTRQETAMTVIVGQAGPIQVPAQGTVWRMSEVDGPWTVVLARDFVALETSSYSNREDLLARWRGVLDALDALEPGPAVYDRLGIRYVDRVVGDDFIEDLPNLVRSEILGPTNITGVEDGVLLASVSQALFRLNSMQVKAAWGLVPENAAIVPGLEPVAERSWMLDVDAFAEENSKMFSVDRIVENTRLGARHAYAFFRWVVTEDFLRRFGCDV